MPTPPGEDFHKCEWIRLERRGCLPRLLRQDDCGDTRAPCAGLCFVCQDPNHGISRSSIYADGRARCKKKTVNDVDCARAHAVQSSLCEFRINSRRPNVDQSMGMVSFNYDSL